MTTRVILLTALLAVLLIACAPRVHERGADLGPPGIEGDAYVTRDGRRLALETSMPEGGGPPVAVILALHGFNDYAAAFRAPAKRWATRGIATYAYDQQGFGRSGPRGVWAGEETLVRDAADMLALLRARHPDARLILLGESMGGAVAMALGGAAARPPAFDGLVLVAPAVWGWSTLPGLYRAALTVSAHLAPAGWVTGEGLRIMPSDNIPMLRAYVADPLVIRKTRTDAVLGLVNLMETAFQAADRLPMGTFMLLGAKDEVIPPGALEMTRARLPPQVRVKTYPDGWHMLLRDLSADLPVGDIAAYALGK